jgi:DNA-binding MarR family transcriptional regulator
VSAGSAEQTERIGQTEQMGQTGHGLDPVIHPTGRLRVCAALASANQVEFSVVRDAVGLSVSALSKQVHTLIDAGYVAQDRDVGDSRRIWLRLTSAGRAAYAAHLAALQALIDAGAQVTPGGT